jgi:DNA repair exonuclease SbcCD nuclease subunit
MKIAHVSDLHLGRKSPGDPQGAERLNSLRNTITKLAAESPDAIVIAGDAFDSPRVDRAVIQEAVRALDKAKNQAGTPIPIVLIPGNHDPSDSDFLWNTFKKSLGTDSAVHLALAPEIVPLADGKLVIEAYPCETRYSPESPWNKRLNPSNEIDGVVRVAVAHGTLQGGPVPEGETEAYPFSQADVDSLAVNYVALGHFHGVYPPWNDEDEIQRSVCYSGTHEPDQFGGDSGWAVIATLGNESIARLRRVRVGNRRWRLLEMQGPTDLHKLDALRAEVESDSDPRRFVIRLKLGAKTRLSPEEGERLDALEASLRALGTHVERHGELQTYINVETLDLSTLPSGAVKQAMLTLQNELAQTTDASRREALAMALQLGWEKFVQ